MSRTAIANRQPAQRSAVTNGRTLFAGGEGDMRSPWARRLRDLIELHVSDLGGPDAISEAERAIVRRAGVLGVELEKLEGTFASGKGTPADLDLYQRSASTQRRLLEAVGLERRARDVTPTLQQYLAGKTGAAA